jgi:hypothetical protein
MHANPLRIGRRSLLGLLATAPLAARADPPAAGDAPPAIQVAGPPDSAAAAWARRLQSPLAAALTRGNLLGLRFAGGVDGVTGVNQFQARTMPDGQNAILFPGTAALSWLAGDSRVRFDATELLPLMASVTPGLIMIRPPPSAPSGQPLRLACAMMPGPSLTGLLGLDLLGIQAEPVNGGGDCLTLVRRGYADAAFICGKELLPQVHAMSEAGLRPAFAVSPLGQPAPADATLFNAPDLLAALPPARRKADPLVTAWQAVAAASTVDVILALPRLSPAAAVARWRRACRLTIAQGDLAAGIAGQPARLLADQQAAAAMASMLADTPAVLALRRWMASQLSWRPT